jgi:hypothetical protein
MMPVWESPEFQLRMALIPPSGYPTITENVITYNSLGVSSAGRAFDSLPPA